MSPQAWRLPPTVARLAPHRSSVRVEPHEALDAHGALRPLFVLSPPATMLHLHPILLRACLCHLDHASPTPTSECPSVMINLPSLKSVCVCILTFSIMHHPFSVTAIQSRRSARLCVFVCILTFSIMHHPFSIAAIQSRRTRVLSCFSTAMHACAFAFSHSIIEFSAVC